MRNRVGSILWGLFFVLLGIGFAGNAFDLWNFTLFFNGWWTLFIIVPCVISIIQNGVKSTNMIGLIVGVLLLLAKQFDVPNVTIGKLILPVILVLIGLSIIFNHSFHRSHYAAAVDVTFNKDGMADYTSVFGGQEITYPNENFEGANILSIFGGLKLDLRSAIFDHATTINATCIFGGAEIIVPPNVIVKTSSIPIFGGVSNKANYAQVPGNPTVYVNSVCVFGGVDVK